MLLLVVIAYITCLISTGIHVHTAVTVLHTCTCICTLIHTTAALYSWYVQQSSRAIKLVRLRTSTARTVCRY
jgi:hypothetical protein